MSMTRRTWNGEGLEALPLKLIIISMILALSMPIIVSNWMNYDRQQTINQLTSELNFIEAQMDQIYNSGLGLGNSKVLEVNIRDGTFAKIEYVEIGDGNLNSLRGKSTHWKLKGEGEHTDIISEGISAKSAFGGPFKLKHGLNKLYLEVKKLNGVVYIEIS